MSNIQTLLIIMFLLSSGACKKTAPEDPQSVYERALEQLKTTRQISYTATSHWENNFAENTFQDTVFMNYGQVDNSHFGFGFYFDAGTMEGIYDGRLLKSYDHNEATIIRTDSAVIATDSTYFESMMMMAFSPLKLPDWDSLTSVTDTLVSGKPYLLATKIRVAPSVNNPGKNIHAQQHFLIDYEQGLVRELINRSIEGNDTIQTITHRFTDIELSDEPIEFSTIDLQRSLSYREMSEAAYYKELDAEVITVGEQLTGKTYPSTSGDLIGFTDRGAEESVIMFSFIGCGGCEYAMREMQQQKFAVKPGVRLYYSSPLDAKPALTNYLEKKGFPFEAFAKESGMNEEFKAVSFPTFVHIDGNGKVLNVISGYKESVAAILF